MQESKTPLESPTHSSSSSTVGHPTIPSHLPTAHANKGTLDDPDKQLLDSESSDNHPGHVSPEFAAIRSGSRPVKPATDATSSAPGSRRPSLGAQSVEYALRQERSNNGYGVDTLPSEADIEAQNAQEKYDPAFDVDWVDGDNDPKNPRSFPTWRKWWIITIVSMCSFSVTVASSIYSSTYDQIIPDFHISREIAALGLSLFVLGLSFGPMLLSPLSEFYGRRPIYLGSWFMFTVWLIPSAAAQNIETILIARFIDGFSGSAFLAVAGGTVGDLFNKKQLQAPMLMYSLAPFIGPAMGPLMGSFINYYVNWRWTYYIMIIWSGVLLFFIIFQVPETYHPVLLRNKARKLREETGDQRWIANIEKQDKSLVKTLITSLYRPFQLLFFEIMVLNLCLYSAILLGILYLFFGAFPQIFSANHDFNLWQNGLTFVGMLSGMLLCGFFDPLWKRIRDNLIAKSERETGIIGRSEPEWRLPSAIVGAIFVPIGLFWFAWTTYPGVHWSVPIIGSAFFGGGALLVFSGVFTFLVDAYPLYAASALAANSFVRCSSAAAFPLFGHQMFERLGFQWAGCLLAFLALAMAPFPYLFFKYGKQLRGRSRYAVSD